MKRVEEQVITSPGEARTDISPEISVLSPESNTKCSKENEYDVPTKDDMPVSSSEQDRSSSKVVERKGQQQTPLPGPSVDEDDSIFSGLDDCSSLPGFANRQTKSGKKFSTSRGNTQANGFTAISNTDTEEDVFSGVSVTSRQLTAQQSVPSTAGIQCNEITPRRCIDCRKPLGPKATNAAKEEYDEATQCEP